MSNTNRVRALLILFFLLAAQLSCSSPIPGQTGAGAQPPEPLYTFTSLPPFPTAAAVTEAPPPADIPIATRTLRPTSTPIPTSTPVVLLTTTPVKGSTAAVVAPYLVNGVRIDGDWGEWKGLTDEYPANNVVWGSKQCSGPEDLSASFHIGWNDAFLFLTIKVRDDLYVQKSTSANIDEGDSIELLLDTLLVDDADSTTLSSDDVQLGLTAGFPHVGKGMSAYRWAPVGYIGTVQDVDIAARAESGLYRIEAAIPWSVLHMTPVAGEHYRFAILVNDNDNGDGDVRQSVISNVKPYPPNDPTNWMELQLVK